MKKKKKPVSFFIIFDIFVRVKSIKEYASNYKTDIFHEMRACVFSR